MTDIEIRESEELAVPGTGALVNLSDPGEVGVALDDIRELEARLREVKRDLTGALVAYWRREGLAKTFPIGKGRVVEIKGGTTKTYDAEAIRDELRAAGMSDERISQIVVEEISYSVKAVEAKRAAAANDEYRAVIERNTVEVEAPHTASVRRR